jgi:peroxiredoxin
VLQLQPHLKEWRELGFELVLVTMDDVKELTTYVSDQKLDTPILLDTKRQVSPRLYKVTGYPTTVFVDKQGIVRRVSVGWGPASLDKFNNLVTELTK